MQYYLNLTSNTLAFLVFLLQWSETRSIWSSESTHVSNIFCICVAPFDRKLKYWKIWHFPFRTRVLWVTAWNFLALKNGLFLILRQRSMENTECLTELTVFLNWCCRRNTARGTSYTYDLGNSDGCRFFKSLICTHTLIGFTYSPKMQSFTRNIIQ